MEVLKLILSLVYLLALLGKSYSDPVVEIENGKIIGRDHGHYLSFESIPYAEPPIGENRFEAPKPYSTHWKGIRNATDAPVKCIQWDQFLPREDLLDGEEDCLTVNVYTPSITDNRLYPVLVLIHGGAFMFGATQSHGHDYIMDDRKAVVVKMSYRLGPLGFLSTEDDVVTGNFGLKDQLLALEWTKRNIAVFNGNPKNITLLGFSSGAAAVHLHILNKRIEKLANSAISFSGTALCPWAITRNPRKQALALAHYLNCTTESSASIKSCLQQKEAADIVRAIKHFQKFGYNPFTVFGPVIESQSAKDAFLCRNPEEIIKSGSSANIPWLASSSKDDGVYNAAELMKKDANGTELIEVLNERWNELAPINLFYNETVRGDYLDDYSSTLRLKYMGNKNFSAENYPLVQKMYTDVLFTNGIEKALKLHINYTSSPVYAYVYDNPAPSGMGQVLSHRKDIEFGTAHGDDFFLLFKSRARKDVEFSDSDRYMSRHFINMVEDFALTGNLHFRRCAFPENNSNGKELLMMELTKNACNTVKEIPF